MERWCLHSKVSRSMTVMEGTKCLRFRSGYSRVSMNGTCTRVVASRSMIMAGDVTVVLYLGRGQYELMVGSVVRLFPVEITKVYLSEC